MNSGATIHMRISLPLLAVVLGITASPAAWAEAADAPSVKINGDFRLRFEEDRDSHTPAGVPRADRARARVRARVWAIANLGGRFELEGRVRTGGSGSQQGANITFADFDHNPTDALKITPDRYALHWKGKYGGVDLGRMGFPFFTANEYFWDGDISPLGGAGHITKALGAGAKLTVNAGGFRLPAGLDHFTGSLYAGQAVVEGGPVLVSAGLFRFIANKSDPARLSLLDGNGRRDYAVLALNGQTRTQLASKPLVFNVDFYRNLEGYAAASDAYTIANRDQRTGYVLSAAWGDAAKPGHVQLGYRYARMGALAVDASYAHDDAARFGTPSQAATTDIRGHDIYANWRVTRRITLGGRAMFMRRITNGEDDKRARIDLNYGF